ncbi:BAR-domain-containing protein [Linderina pennispora]|uniref:BAR-domain-containing protein n=1 Tax=Linderina pennispora TaxID=61395 RepID=A0A1Y1W4G5_9FUNG|nr:BAR-domain-containing protein [Linderina pennispora]ORX68377.1 BAR-domain-containing protein [Linderina pennispora]
MSKWDNMKKSMSRAGTGLRMGNARMSADPEYNEQEQRFRSLERKAIRLLQDAKDYNISIIEMTSAQKKLAENLSAFLLDVQRPREYQAAYRQATTEIDETARVQFDEVYAHTVLDPLARYCGFLPEFDKAFTKRNHRLQDVEKAKSVLSKEQTKGDPAAIERAEQDLAYAEQTYEQLNRALITEIPKLINARVYVIDPSFEAFVKAQLQFFSDSKNQLDQVARFVPPQTGQDDDAQLNQRIETVMGQLRGLSICSLNV